MMLPRQQIPIQALSPPLSPYALSSRESVLETELSGDENARLENRTNTQFKASLELSPFRVSQLQQSAPRSPQMGTPKVGTRLKWIQFRVASGKPNLESPLKSTRILESNRFALSPSKSHLSDKTPKSIIGPPNEPEDDIED